MTKKVSLKKRFLALTTVAVMAVTSLVPTISFAKRGVPVADGKELITKHHYDSKVKEELGWTGFNPTEKGGNGQTISWEDTVVATTEEAPHVYALQIPGYYDAAVSSKQYGTFITSFHNNRGEETINGIDKGLNYKISFQFKPTSTNYAYNMRFENQQPITWLGVERGANLGLCTIRFDKDGKVKIYSLGGYTYTSGEWQGAEDATYTANAWNDFELYVNRETTTIRAYVNDEYVGSIDYGAWIKSQIPAWRETLPPQLGRIQEMVIVRGSDNTWYNADIITSPETELADEKLWIDEFEMNWLTTGCYGTASYNSAENKITVNLTEPVIYGSDDISLMKADGTAAEVSGTDFSGDHKTITVTPETQLDANTEYVLSLPDDMKTMDEKAPYSSEIYFTTPNSSELIYRVNENFEGTFTPVNGGTSPVMTNGATVFSTAYRTENGVSDTEDEGENNKVLKMTSDQDNGHAGLAFNLEKYVNSPTFNYIANDFSIEFDLYHPDAGRIEGAADDHWGWYMRVGHSKVGDLGGNNSMTLLSGGDAGGNTVLNPVFGVSTGQKVGGPIFVAGDFTSSMKQQDNASYVNNNVKAEPIDTWTKYRLDFTIGKTRNDCKITGYMNNERLGEWKLPLNEMNSEKVAAPRVGYFEIRLYGKNSAWQNRPVIYLDNLKVWERNRPEAYIETISVYDIENNEEFGPMSTASDTVNKLKLKFTDAVTNVLGYKDATEKTEYNQYKYSQKFSVVDEEGSNVAYTLGSYDAEDNSITLTFNEMLKVGKEYTVTVTDLWNVHGAENGTKAGTYYHMPDYKAKFIITPDGQISVKNISLEPDTDKNDGTYILKGDVKNTYTELKTVQTIISEYEDNILTHATVDGMNLPAGTYTPNATLKSGITPNEASDLMKAFVLDGMQTIRPISIFDTVDLTQ